MSKRKLIVLTAAVLTVVTLLTSCSFYTGSLFGSLFSGRAADSTTEAGDITETPSGKAIDGNDDLVELLLKEYSYYDYELTEDDLAKAAVYAYALKTGDRYAYYYTAEEFAAFNAEESGETQGIGITVIENVDYSCIEVISVLPDTPAEKAGVEPGDLIVRVGAGDDAKDCTAIGYEQALKLLQGVKGTYCDFGVYREGVTDIIDFHILRDSFTSESVMFTKVAADEKIGLIKLIQFDLTTPTQFKNAMESLIAEGCEKFVIDLRYNPGGDLASVRAVLSLFLEVGDTVIVTEDRKGVVETTLCEPITYKNAEYSGCTVTRSDIGKYRDYKISLITNKNTASAAELFTGTLKTQNLAYVVGTTTYGKGCMQQIIPLAYFGSRFSGAIKMTTQYYHPGGMENYHDIGIEPHLEVELGEEAAKLNIYKLFKPEYQNLDNQLAEAVKSLYS